MQCVSTHATISSFVTALKISCPEELVKLLNKPTARRKLRAFCLIVGSGTIDSTCFAVISYQSLRIGRNQGWISIHFLKLKEQLDGDGSQVRWVDVCSWDWSNIDLWHICHFRRPSWIRGRIKRYQHPWRQAMVIASIWYLSVRMTVPAKSWGGILSMVKKHCILCAKEH